MRYFLFLSFSITCLPTGIIEASCPCWLIFFTGAFQGGWPGNRSTSSCAIPMTTVTGRTDNDLCLTTATMIKATWAVHRQKGRWGLDLFHRCVTLIVGRALARFWGMASSMTVKSLWRHTFSQRHLSLYRLHLFFACLLIIRVCEKTSIVIFTSCFLRMGKNGGF